MNTNQKSSEAACLDLQSKYKSIEEQRSCIFRFFRRKNINKYTLIEVMVVAIIIIILASIVFAAVSLAKEKIAIARARSVLEMVCVAMENYKARTGYYIQAPEVTDFMIDNPDPDKVEFTDFIDYEKLTPFMGTEIHELGTRTLSDPWSRPFKYQCPGRFNTESFDLISKGPDGGYGDYEGDGARDYGYEDDDPRDAGQGDDIANFYHKSQ